MALLAPLFAIGLDSYLPAHLPFTAILDLPLLVVVYFAIVKRSPVVGACAGGVIGILQDALTRQPLGVNGITKTVVGLHRRPAWKPDRHGQSVGAASVPVCAVLAAQPLLLGAGA